MKNLFSKSVAFLSAVALSFFMIGSCTVADLTEDIVVYAGTAFLSSPITIQVADAANLANAPTDLAVTIEGRDKAKIFSILGESKIKAINGIIALGTKTSDMPTVASPLQFTVVLTASNYITVRKDYNLTASYDLASDKVTMVNLATPPAGVSIQTTSFATTTTGTAVDVPLASPLTGGKVEQANFVVKAGTKPLAADGTVLTGAIATQLIHYDIRTDASVGSLAGGFTNMTVKSGTTTAQQTFTPAGFYSLSMTSGGKDVSTLSTPMDVSIDIDPDFYNQAKNRKVQVGDSLDIISQSNGESTWNTEGKAVVTSVGGKLKLTYKQPHLSVWVVGVSIGRSGLNVTVKYADFKVSTDFPTKSNNKAADCSVPRELYNYKVFDANNPRTIYTQGTSTLGNNELLDANNNTTFVVSPTTEAILRVTDASDKLVYETPKQLITNSTFDLKGKLPVNKSVIINASISASCGVNTVFTPAGYSLMYRDMAASNSFGGFQNLVTFDASGKGCAKGLIAGHTYDFSMAGQTLSKDLKRPAGITIPETGDLTINIESPVYKINTSFTIHKVSAQLYDFTLERYELPANICKIINEKLGQK